VKAISQKLYNVIVSSLATYLPAQAVCGLRLRKYLQQSMAKYGSLQQAHYQLQYTAVQSPAKYNIQKAKLALSVSLAGLSWRLAARWLAWRQYL